MDIRPFISIPLLAAVALTSAIVSCDQINPTTDQVQEKQTEQLLSEANRQVGMPNILNFTERKLAKSILELRDSEGLRTWTYIVDMHGEIHFLTESVGYGLPYSVQFTNPEKIADQGHSYGYAVLPQADPNGLFMPDGLSATWILAATEDGPKPIYVEPQILVSPFPLHEEEE